ncbi:hypothetical protein YH63_006770 [Afipia massiliensis]|uniref:VrrB protein n=2 Tax=Afipia massiliensis TaxID=211460 RepID=A0A4U6BXE3_9BRAD|nr:hypothetical protein YH63_006770 [Afipia massiliensis]
MNVRTIFGLAAVAGLLAVTAPADRADAMSLINPGSSSAAKQASETMTTDVHWRRHHHHHRMHRHHGWHGHHGWHRRHHGWHGHRHWYRRHWS